jgi:hypothetical protein
VKRRGLARLLWGALVFLGLVWGALLSNATGAPGQTDPPPAPDEVPSPPAAPSQKGPADVAVEDTNAEIFQSRQACEAGLAARGNAPRTNLRLGSYNVRWFPAGGPGKKANPKKATDVPWLACVLAYLGADAYAVQEFTKTPLAQKALSELLASLSRLTRATWRAQLDECPRETSEHVGVLWNSEAMTLRSSRNWAELNPSGSPCGGMLRPGLRTEFTWRGHDFVLTSVHLKAGDSQRDFDLRTATFQALASHRPATTEFILGDWNTLGCRGCLKPFLPGEERAARGRALPAWTFSPDPTSCSEYHRGKATLLDGGLVVGAAVHGRAAGPCEALSCGHLGRQFQEASAHLSDHCPLVFDVLSFDPKSAR